MDAKKDEEKEKYCIYCKKYHFNCKHKNPMAYPKEYSDKPFTWSQEIGWKKPVDHFVYGHEHDSVMVRNFYFNGHLQ